MNYYSSAICNRHGADVDCEKKHFFNQNGDAGNFDFLNNDLCSIWRKRNIVLNWCRDSTHPYIPKYKFQKPHIFVRYHHQIA
jgi:hypothetical protein